MTPRIETHHRVEHGVHANAGLYALVRIERTLRHGRVLTVTRTTVEWFRIRTVAEQVCRRRNRAAGLAAEAERQRLRER